MTYASLTAVLLACLGLMFPGPLRAETDDGERVEVLLEPELIPLSAYRNLGAGTYVRSAPPEQAEIGFDTLFTIAVGKEGRTLNIHHKGWRKEEVALFYTGEAGLPEEIPRIEKGVHAYYLAFGPVEIDGVPPFTLHLYYPPRNVSRWRTGRKVLFLLPMECLAGELRLGERAFKVGLFDRNLNGTYTDPCLQHSREGDWFLVDVDGDGAFLLGYASKGESLGLTRYVQAGGGTWDVALEGQKLVLHPVSLSTCKVKIEGAGPSSRVFGWSYACGSIQGALDGEECIEVPEEKFLLYSYRMERGAWRLSGSLRSCGVLDPAGAEGPLVVSVGPPVEKVLRSRLRGGDVHFSFSFAGRARERLTLYKDGNRIDLVLVVVDGEGKEVFREAMRYG